MSDPSTVLCAQRLSAGYVHRRRRRVVLDGVDLELAAGEVACLLGPNGAGKSTLLRTLVGSQPALAGQLWLDGRDVASTSARERARLLSVVLTDRVDVGFLSGRALAQLGRAPHRGWFSRLGDDDRDIVEWALDAAGATSIADRMVHELSDGERQRVMIARALAQQPRLLVLDEPTAFLDVTRRIELVALLRRLASSVGLAVLMSTHEVDLAMRSADRAWLVYADGRFVAGAPEDLALAGRLQDAFASEDVTFDETTGSLAVHLDAHVDLPTVALAAHGPARMWARRAIERAGWRIDPAAPCRVEVRPDAHWTLTSPPDVGSTTASGDDLAALVAALRARAPRDAAADQAADQISPPTNKELHR